jgi:hypothetical protein
MSNGEETIYVGSGKEIGRYGDVSLTVFLDAIPTQHLQTHNGKQFVKLIVSKRKTPSEKGATHSIKINTYRKEGNEESRSQDQGDAPNVEDIPF